MMTGSPLARIQAAWLGLALTVMLTGGLHAQSPANDAFANRILLAGSTNQFSGVSTQASREPGEPNHHGYDIGASVWWTWTAPDTGPVMITTSGSDFDTVLAVYSGSAIAQLSLVAENDDNDGGSTSSVRFEAEAGRAYQIAVDGFNGASGAVLLRIELAVTPTLPSFVSEPEDALVLDGAQTNLVFRVAATGTQPFRYEWFLNGLLLIGQSQPELVVSNPTPANAGMYRVLVSNVVGTRPSRDIVLTVLTSLPNDAFEHGSPIVGTPSTVSSQNRNATAQEGDPAPLGKRGGRSVWWTWTAPAAGLVTLSTEGSSFDTLLGVYRGSTLTSLEIVAENDDQIGGRASKASFRAAAGATYHIMVDGFRGEDGVVASGDIRLHLVQMPDNDAFAFRLPIEGSVNIVEDSIVGATREEGEPEHGLQAAGTTAWWTWTAPDSGLTHIATGGSSAPVLVAVYSGSSLASLNQIVHDDSARTNAELRFQAEMGQTYQIALDGYAGLPPASRIVLRLTQSASGNDDFANRTPLLGSTNVVHAHNGSASREPGERFHASNIGGASLWWSWIAPHSGPVQITTAGSRFDTLLAVYSGPALAELSLIAQSDDDGDLLQGAVTFDAVADTEYQIAVDGYGDEEGVETGEVTLGIFQVVPPEPGGNDMLAARFSITGQTNSVMGSNRSASKEPGEPDHAGNRGGRSIWWSWIAPASDPVTVNTLGSSFDTLLGVYTGTQAAGLTMVGSDDDSAGSGKSSLTFLPAAGVEYLIAVDGYLDGTDQASGDVVLNLQQYPPGPQIANDEFANRTPFLPQIQTIIGSNIGATREVGEPAHVGSSSGASVWWSWVASESGPVTIDTLGSAIDTVLSVYTGASLDSLILVSENDDIGGGVNKSRVRFQASVATEYLIAVEGYGGRIGAITLNVKQDPETPQPPALTQQPRSHTRFAGGSGGGTNVSFQAVATGSSPLAFQWQHDGADLPGATGATLTLTNVTSANAGIYRVLVSNPYGSAVSTNARLSIVDAPFNDRFDDRIALAGTSTTAYGSNLQASKESNEPNHAGNLGGRSVWWRWTAPADGLVSIDSFGSSFDTGLSVYEGNSIASLNLLVENDDLLSGRNNNSFVKFQAVAGREYQIAVDGFKTNGTHGSVVVNLHQPPEPPRLLTQPQSQDVIAGSALTLEVTGAGVTPLYQYQWFWNNEPLPGATSSTLMVTNATLGHRGRYHVVVSNEFGSRPSETADVWVRLRPPVAQRLGAAQVIAGGGVRFEFADPDATTLSDAAAFEVEWTDALSGTSTVWNRHPASVHLIDGKLVFEDASVAAGSRFYRVRER